MKIKYIDRKTGEKITEKPPGERFLRFLYHTPFGQLTLRMFVKRKALTSLYGRLMNRSNSKERIAPFVKRYEIDMSESEQPIEAFASFNEFFYRKLKPSVRPIQEGFVSPGDGKIIAFESVKDLDHFFVKGNRFSLKRYLQDEALFQKFQDASLIILRLAPNDYHRFHFPYSGFVSEMKTLKGHYFSVSPYALSKDFTRVFCENKRAFTLLQSEDKGDILVSPVGATMVGSIIPTYEPHTKVEKGDEMGYFAFGGSSILILINKTKLTIDRDIIENTKKHIETAVKMGEKIGR